jgi:hypothetical protein
MFKKILITFCFILSILAFPGLPLLAQEMLIEGQIWEVTEISPFPAAVHGLECLPGGDILVADTFKKAHNAARLYLLKYPYTGVLIDTGIQGEGVAGMAWRQESIYVAFLYENYVRRYDSNFQVLESWPIHRPWNITWDDHGIYVVTYSGQVVQLMAEGDSKVLFEELEFPFDIVATGSDSFWISEQVGSGKRGRVARFSKAGRLLEEVDYTFLNPEGLALDGEGNLYIADTEAGKVVRRKAGGEVELVTDRYKLPICLAISRRGELLVNCNDSGGKLLVVRAMKKKQ